MNILRATIQLILIVLMTSLWSCRSTEEIPQGILLKKNMVKIRDGKNIKNDELKSLVRQEPNKRLFGLFKMKLMFYRLGLAEPIGEKPVIYDPELVNRSSRQMKLYLNNVGYFNSNIRDTVKINNEKASVRYDIFPGPPYRIASYKTSIRDKKIDAILNDHSPASLIEEKDIFNAYTLDDERSRLTDILRNNGFYFFNRDYIYYTVDSTGKKNKMDVVMNIKDPEEMEFQPGFDGHHQYYINNIYIYPDFEPFPDDPDDYDTLSLEIHQISEKRQPHKYHFVYLDKMKIRPKTLTQSIIFHNNELFRQREAQATYRNLTDLKLYRYIDIKFDTTFPTETKTIRHKHALDCNITLSRAPLQAFTIETEGTNSGGDLGIGGNFVYQNRNVFRGAELLRLKLKGALEAQKLPEDQDNEDQFLFFNTFEYGVEASLIIPKFLVPVRQERFPKYFKPQTSISAGINFQQRPRYTRYISNLTFGYEWKESVFKKHILYPAEISAVNIEKTSSFQADLDSLNNDRLENQFSNHFISGIRYSFIFSNQEVSKIKDFVYFRGNVETAGNLLNAVSDLTNAPRNPDGEYATLFNLRFAQYVKTDVDFRYYNVLTREQTLAMRVFAGIGVPYANSTVLPFEKGFYAGGANGMRGWQVRSLGPGAYSEEGAQIDRMGDVQLEANIEYRFPIYSFFKGALFTDIGNIWLLSENEQFPDGVFEGEKFYRQFAIDAGFGLRIDFDFFIFRLDAALPLRNPAKPTQDRWVIRKAQFNDVVFNFGIGYPF